VQPTSKIRVAIIIMTTTHVRPDRYTFSAREMLHTYLERGAERNRNRSFPLFQQSLFFSSPFIGSKGYRDSYHGRDSPLTEKSRNPFVASRKSASRWRTIVTGKCRHDHYLFSRTFSHSQPDPYGSSRIRSTRKNEDKKKRPTSLLNELTRADICIYEVT